MDHPTDDQIIYAQTVLARRRRQALEALLTGDHLERIATILVDAFDERAPHDVATDILEYLADHLLEPLLSEEPPVRVARLEPGDRLVVRMPRRSTMDQAVLMKERTSSWAGLAEDAVLVVDGGIELEILRPTAEEVQDRVRRWRESAQVMGS